MKTFILILSLLTLLTLSTLSMAAQEGFGSGNRIGQKITCDFQNKIEKHELTVINGALVSVEMASNPSTGYSWISNEGLESEFTIDSNRVGSGAIEKFELPLLAEVNKFTFTYKRPWGNKIISKCTIIVHVK